MLTEVIEEIPMGRLGQASDVAKTAAFLASAQSEFLTGLSIIVSGGRFVD